METNGDQNQTSPTREVSVQTGETDVIYREGLPSTNSIQITGGNIGFYLIDGDRENKNSQDIFPKMGGGFGSILFDIKNTFSELLSYLRALYDIILLSIICCFYLGAGTLCFYLVRHQISGKKSNDVLDALYFTIVLLTSVGYGDLTPDTTLSLLVATLFGIIGILVTGALLSLIAGMYLATPKRALVKSIMLDDGNLQEVESHIKKRNFTGLAVFLVVHMAVGIPVMVSIEDLDFIHAFYCINATIISVGSDNCFSSKGGRVFALLWIVDGMVILSFVLFSLMEMYTQRRQISLVKKALKRKPTLADLQAADLDGDGVVGPAEYILYRLREMEKLSQQDMEPIIEEYQSLDANNIGINDGNEAPPTRARLIPSFRIDEIRCVHKERKFSEYFVWLQNSHDLWKIIIILSIYLGAGTICFYLARHHISGKKTNSILDALFFTLVLTTSVGYADLSPDDTLAILLASLFALLGVFLIGVVLSMATELLVKQRERMHKIVSNYKHQTVADANSRKRRESKKVRNKLMLIVVLFLIHMAVGTSILVSVEDLDFIHAFYCISITITSASSDTCFSTKNGRVVGVFLILFGTLYKAHVLFTFMEIYPQRIQLLVVKSTMRSRDMEAADLDGDGVVVLAEYILYKLMYTGKLCREDIAPIFQEFQRLDVDDTGRLSLREFISSYQ